MTDYDEEILILNNIKETRVNRQKNNTDLLVNTEDTNQLPLSPTMVHIHSPLKSIIKKVKNKSLIIDSHIGSKINEIDDNNLTYHEQDHKLERKDFYKNPIKKKGIHKVTWLDKTTKNKMKLIEVVNIDNYKNYLSTYNNIELILGKEANSNEEKEIKKKQIKKKEPWERDENEVRCKCNIF